MSVLKSLFRLLGRREAAAPGKGSAEQFFSEMYRENAWGGRESRSGTGSEGRFAEQKVALFRRLIAEHGVRSLLDLGCGDFHWMREIAPLLERYHGVDIVPELIRANQERFASARVTFQCLDLGDPARHGALALRKTDLVACLDVIGHMLNTEVDALLGLILRRLDARYLLVANRRDAQSAEFLVREKTRYEGIDIERHALFEVRPLARILQLPALYPDDFYDLYELKRPHR